MREKEKAAPVYQTEDGSGEQTLLPGVRFSDSDCITVQHAAQEIADILLRGSSNALPLQYLQTLTGLDGRTIRRKIQLERQAGACICVNNRDGYYLADTVAERDACARSMLARAEEVRRTAQAIAAAEVLTDG